MLTIKSSTERITTSMVLQKRIRYIFDELISNIYEYYQEQNFSGEITSVDGLLQSNNFLEFVLTSNIDPIDKESLKDHIDYINSLDARGLKDFYKKKLGEKEIQKNKVGIGLISIRMKSGNPIKYEFKKSRELDVVSLKIGIALINE